MAPSTYLGFKIYNGWPDELKKMAPKYKWTDAYLKTALRCAQETENKVKSSNRNSAYILGKRCFLKELREESLEKPMDMASKIKIPVFILQGKEDEEVSIEFVSNLDKTLTDSGNTNHTLTYFGYLGHFFGQGVNDGVHKLRYETDKNVLENIKNWLDKVIVKQP